MQEMSNILCNETICMKCQSLFSGKNRKNIINLSSAEFAQRMVRVTPYKALYKVQKSIRFEIQKVSLQTFDFKKKKKKKRINLLIRAQLFKASLA